MHNSNTYVKYFFSHVGSIFLSGFCTVYLDTFVEKVYLFKLKSKLNICFINDKNYQSYILISRKTKKCLAI